MPSRFYDLDLAADDSLTATPSATAPAPMPADAQALLTRLTRAFNRVRLRVPASPGRTVYAQQLLTAARIGLQDGDLASANVELDSFDNLDLGVTYYLVGLDADNSLHASPPPWAPRPMPDEVNTFTSRVDKSINKIRLLVTDDGKRAGYLATLLGYARRGLQEGDVKSATAALDDFEAQFVDEEGPAIRKAYVTSTLRVAAVIVLAALLIGALVTLAIGCLPSLKALPMSRKVVPTPLALIIGICVGISFFAFVRNLNLTFDSLGHFDPANLESWLRFVFVGLVTLILCMLLLPGLVKLEIAGVRFQEFAHSRLTAIILGIICGYSDVTITKLLTGVLNRNS